MIHAILVPVPLTEELLINDTSETTDGKGTKNFKSKDKLSWKGIEHLSLLIKLSLVYYMSDKF